MQIKRALVAVALVAAMLVGLLGAGAAPTHASIHHVGGDVVSTADAGTP